LTAAEEAGEGGEGESARFPSEQFTGGFHADAPTILISDLKKWKHK
jgi:hypothetical protein